MSKMLKSVKNPELDHCDNCFGSCQIMVKLFSQLGSSHVEKYRTIKILKPNETLVLGVEMPEGFSCISEGHLLLQLKIGDIFKTVKICGPGEVIGIGHWHVPHFYQFVALDTCVLCYFEKESFDELVRKDPAVCNLFLQYFAKQLQHRDLRIGALQNISVKNRVCSILISLSEKFGVSSKIGIKIEISVSRKVIAELCGTSVESLSRVISELQEDQIISRHGRKLIVNNFHKLSKLANS